MSEGEVSPTGNALSDVLSSRELADQLAASMTRIAELEAEMACWRNAYPDMEFAAGMLCIRRDLSRKPAKNASTTTPITKLRCD